MVLYSIRPDWFEGGERLTMGNPQEPPGAKSRPKTSQLSHYASLEQRPKVLNRAEPPGENPGLLEEEYAHLRPNQTKPGR
jgi:hypothetical protein